MKAKAWCIALAAAGLAACSGRGAEKSKMPDVALPTLAAGTAPSLASCRTDKCLTVYVAPWCGYCRAATPALLSLRRYLKTRNVEMRVIVGLDRPDAILQYAQTFGPQTLLDVNDSFHAEGVPHFFVSDRSGEILKEVSGYPMGAGDSDRDLADYFGLL